MEHQQTQHTEKIIKEMLEFLDSTSEEEDEIEKLTESKCCEKINDVKKDLNNNDNLEEMEKEEEKLKIKLLTKSKTNSVKDANKLKQYPIWNTTEIVSNNKNALYQIKSPAAIAEPIWRQSSLGMLSKTNESADGDISSSENVDNEDWHTKLETNCRRSASNSYIQEVQKAIYGDTAEHPASDSADYYQAAQNYAVYGKNFLDFPENLQSVINDKNSCSNNSNFLTNYGNGLYPISQTAGAVGGNNFLGTGYSSIAYNNFGKPNAATSSMTGQSNVTPISSSTTAYYQMFNGIQTAPTRPSIGNTVGNATPYGIFLGNKLTYVAAAPAATSIVYNQHTSSTTNFISNSLANAALAASPAILYSNPMLATTQQYLNTYFKETQFLSTGTATNPTQAAPVVTTTTAGIYERLVYNQMLQQQIYQQTHQAAAVAAMYQYKQRATAATVAAASRQPTNASVLLNTGTALGQPTTSGAPTSNTNSSTLNTSGRQSTKTNILPNDVLSSTQQQNSNISKSPITVLNASDEVSDKLND